MLAILNGSLIPQGPFAEAFASFMSTSRHVLTAAFLDRAVLSAVSDLNSMRMAAQTVGLNPGSVISRHVRPDGRRHKWDEARRAGWIADTLADPGLALARWQSEVPPAAFAERLSSGVLRIQVLRGRPITPVSRSRWKWRAFSPRTRAVTLPASATVERVLQDKGITDAEWVAFTDPATLFTTTNGATFASPIYWREATSLDRATADDLFLRMQAIVEEQTEFAVPTGSLWARAFVEGGMPPGSIGYELAKSGLMFKSFAMTFSVNQVRRMIAQTTVPGKIGYAVDLAVGATVMGAVAQQLINLASGHDPADMSRPEFWATAALRGGAFGIMGDVAAASSRPLGGLGTYAAGPVLGLAQDAYALAIGNAQQTAAGEDTNLGSEAVAFVNRYLPGGDLPAIGLAIDRLFLDQLQVALDPESVDEMASKAERDARKRGSGAWWMPGEYAPGRLPSLAGG